MSYEKLSAIYMNRSTPREVQEAFLQLLASFSATGTTEFPYVREVPIHAQVTDGHLFQVSIPEILETVVDRKWGQAEPPCRPTPPRTASRMLSITVQNIRYRMHNEGAKLHFDYSRRQAN
jgi:hypothetical protein